MVKSEADVGALFPKLTVIFPPTYIRVSGTLASHSYVSPNVTINDVEYKVYCYEFIGLPGSNTYYVTLT